MGVNDRTHAFIGANYACIAFYDEARSEGVKLAEQVRWMIMLLFEPVFSLPLLAYLNASTTSDSKRNCYSSAVIVAAGASNHAESGEKK